MRNSDQRVHLSFAARLQGLPDERLGVIALCDAERGVSHRNRWEKRITRPTRATSAGVQFDKGPYNQAQANTYWEGKGVPDYTGIVFLRSEVSVRDVSDGTSQTIMLGEKYLRPDDYGTGKAPQDNWHLFHGFDGDTQCAGYPDWGGPLMDSPGFESQLGQWGSAHPGGARHGLL